MPGQIRPGFDSPAYRCAKQFVAMCMALSIAAVFQILILRQPARQTLRQRLARISWQLNGLGVLLSYLTEAVMPMVEVRRPSAPPSSATVTLTLPPSLSSQDSTDHAPPDWDVVKVVQKELVGREVEIQGELLGLMPVMKCVLSSSRSSSPPAQADSPSRSQVRFGRADLRPAVQGARHRAHHPLAPADPRPAARGAHGPRRGGLLARDPQELLGRPRAVPQAG